MSGSALNQFVSKIATVVGAQVVANHASTHENGGDDEINVDGLSGELADNQPPKAHAASHAAGAADEVLAEDLGTAGTAGQVVVGAGGGALALGDLEDISTALADGKTVASDGAGALQTAQGILEYVSDPIAFSDLGSGASDDITLTPAFPDNAFVYGAMVEIDTMFDGEADLALLVGDAGDPDGLIASKVIHQVAAGMLDTVAGAESGGRFEADYTPVARFTATELDDVSVGALKIRILYSPVAVIE